jgi:hypothetical protein
MTLPFTVSRKQTRHTTSIIAIATVIDEAMATVIDAVVGVFSFMYRRQQVVYGTLDGFNMPLSRRRVCVFTVEHTSFGAYGVPRSGVVILAVREVDTTKCHSASLSGGSPASCARILTLRTPAELHTPAELQLVTWWRWRCDVLFEVKTTH